MTEPRKIAVLCNYELLPERVGGMDYFFWQFDQECKENGVQVDWFFSNRSDHGAYSKLRVFDSNNQSVENYFLDFCKQHKTQYSHIVTHFIELCTPFFYKIKQISRAKIIVVDHNPRPLYGYPFKKKFEKKIKGILFSRYIDCLVGVSRYTVNEIINDFGFHLQKKVKTIYNGVVIDDIRIRNHRNPVKPTFLVVSHLRESKGIQDLIEAVNRLPLRIKEELKIDVYGDGPYKRQLIEKAERLNVMSCFSFMGSASNLKDLFFKYDYMLQPTHMECFSLSILESLAANVPVITTNVGGNEEAIANGVNGYIFEVKNVNALAVLLEQVYLGNSKIESNTRKVVEDCFSLTQMVANHLALILDNKS